jgi:raffinose/stachyose/melibiose transport system permease protein
MIINLIGAGCLKQPAPSDTIRKGGCPEMNERLKPKKRVFLVYLTVPVAIYVFTVIIPVFYAAYFSFFKWKSGPKKTFDGLANYQRMLNDSVFWSSFQNNMFLTFFSIVGQIGFAFLFATMLNSKFARAKRLHRTLCYFPVTISAVVVAYIWSMIYNYDYGLLNYFLRQAGMSACVKSWLSDTDYSLKFISLTIVWQYIGYYMVILISAFTSINPNIFEMAEIDGANAWQRALYIAMPLLKPTFVVMLTLCISGNMKTFDHVYVMTGGGPGNATSVMALYAYNISFIRNNMGYGSALSIGLLVLSLSVIMGTRWGINWLFAGKEA